MLHTSSHALLKVFSSNGVDRVFVVPGESYLGVLDALSDFPEIDVVTCRHEAGAGFMAVADGRLTGRPGVVMVSRGPGATNASIAVHTAQQDAIPIILLIGQIPKRDLRREAFQEIDYQKVFGPLVKWVAEPTEPEQLAEIAFKAVRIATTGTPGPVVIVIPEDIQQKIVPVHAWKAPQLMASVPAHGTLDKLRAKLASATRPLIVAGGKFDVPGGREALQAFAEAWHIPVALSFRRHDVFDNVHPLYVGDLGLANSKAQIDAFHSSDLILALGTRMGDITSQGYTFPELPIPGQSFVHCYPDDHIVGLHFTPEFGLVCDPVALVRELTPVQQTTPDPERVAWAQKLNEMATTHAHWPTESASDGIPFVNIVQAVQKHAPADTAICVDAGTFAAPVYRYFKFTYPQRLMAPLSGAMGYGTPAAIATQLRRPSSRVVCMVGDGGFMMTGNEMIAAVERKLPIIFILSNNNSYGSIRIHQEKEYPGRHRGTTLFNPDFTALAASFGMKSLRLSKVEEVDKAIEWAIGTREPLFIEVMTSLENVLPKSREARIEKDVA